MDYSQARTYCACSRFWCGLFVYFFLSPIVPLFLPGRVAQSIGRLTQEPDVSSSIPVRPHTFVSPSADSTRAVVSYWRKYVHEVLVNRLGGLRVGRKRRKETPQKLTQLSSRSHPRHLVGKRTAQKDTPIDTTSLLSLPRKSVVRLIDCPDMTRIAYRGRKTTTTTTFSFFHPRY